jgi:uncharacterized membrane protein YfcA
MTGPPSLFYAIAFTAVILLGLSKGGFVGVGALSLPLLSLVLPPLQGAAVLLPVLLVQDLVSVWAFRKTFDRHVLKIMIPSGTIGVLAGYLFAASVPVIAVLGAVGLISAGFGAYRLLVDRLGLPISRAMSTDAFGRLCGLVSGFTSQIALGGGPPYQLWVMPRRLPRDHLIGTTAIFFAVENLLKVPTYFALGQVTASTVHLSLLLLPVATLSTFAGMKLARRTGEIWFYRIVYLMMIAVGVKLMIGAVQGA